MGYFVLISWYGILQEFMYFVDVFYQAGIGIILDWVFFYFLIDVYGLVDFDGMYFYDYVDLCKGFYFDWKSVIFNYGWYEVKAFLIFNVLFWLDCYYIDGLRVDVVVFMLYFDYFWEEGEWILNIYGGNENLEVIVFLREFNEIVYKEFLDMIIIVEELIVWMGVFWLIFEGGLGFGQKWMMGWMYDIFSYFKNDFIYW